MISCTIWPRQGRPEFVLEMYFSNICCVTSTCPGNTLYMHTDLGCQTSGPGCSKLTTPLVNVSLKFQTLISQICQYFLLKKCEKLLQCKSFSHFFNKNISVFGYKVVKHLMS